MAKLRKAFSTSKKLRLRIIAGALKGRVMLVPENPDTRPTRDMVREALFDILSDTVANANFLDLYAGTGAVGIEAWSRGAKNVTLIDNSVFQVKMIKEIATSFGIVEEIEIVKNDAGRFLTECVNMGRKFDIIYCDPPYDQTPMTLQKTLTNIPELLKPDGILIFEHEHNVEYEEAYLGLFKFKERKYGTTMLSFYARPLPGNV